MADPIEWTYFLPSNDSILEVNIIQIEIFPKLLIVELTNQI
jgi:hypothetical protein